MMTKSKGSPSLGDTEITFQVTVGTMVVAMPLGKTPHTPVVPVRTVSPGMIWRATDEATSGSRNRGRSRIQGVGLHRGGSRARSVPLAALHRAGQGVELAVKMSE